MRLDRDFVRFAFKMIFGFDILFQNSPLHLFPQRSRYDRQRYLLERVKTVDCGSTMRYFGSLEGLKMKMRETKSVDSYIHMMLLNHELICSRQANNRRLMTPHMKPLPSLNMHMSYPD